MHADAELDLLRSGVSCAAVLEHMEAGWRLDRRQSTKRALKYRRGPGEIIIVNHDGRGWWDATSDAKGDVFTLVRHLNPSLTFGEVCQVLRRYVGVNPTYKEFRRDRRAAEGASSPAQRWARRPALCRGDPAWLYLSRTRAIPDAILLEAAQQHTVRFGAYGSAWFAHRWRGEVTHVEVRSSTYKGSLREGHKTLFRFGREGAAASRVTVLEAPVDALSLAALEQAPSGTLYVATGGGMGPGTVTALQESLIQLQPTNGVLVSAADANVAGDRFAARHRELAAAAGVAFERLRPPEGQDWNDVLVRARNGSRNDPP